jgi:Putative Zn-dependent protease, contains TPR repeats
MSLMAINRGFKKYGTVLGALLAFILIVGVVLSGLGMNLGGDPAAMNPQAAGETVATVGEAKITSGQLDQVADRLVQQRMMFGMGGRPQPVEMLAYRLQALDQFRQQQALLAAAKTAGVQVSGADIQAARDKAWQPLRAQYAEALGLKSEASDAEINNALAKQNPGLNVRILRDQALPEEQLRIQATAEKLEEKLKQEIDASEDAVRRSLSDMKVRHVLIKFGGGALPEEQAKTKAQKILDQVKADPSKMGELAKANSDDPGSKPAAGVYEWAPDQRGNLVPEFKAALEKLKPGETYPELVRVVSPGYSGFHIIRLEELKEGKTFPKDFAKEKQKYIDQYKERMVQEKVQDAVRSAEPSVTVTISDPLLQAVQTLQESSTAPDQKAREAKLNEVLTKLDAVKKESDALGVVPSMRAMIYTQLEKPTEAIAAYQDALTYRNSVETRLALAQLLAKQKDKEGAKQQLDEAQKLAVTEPMQYFQIGSVYDEIGDKAKGEAARKKAEELFKRMQELQAPPVTSAPAPAAAPSPAPAAAKP